MVFWEESSIKRIEDIDEVKKENTEKREKYEKKNFSSISCSQHDDKYGFVWYEQ